MKFNTHKVEPECPANILQRRRGVIVAREKVLSSRAKMAMVNQLANQSTSAKHSTIHRLYGMLLLHQLHSLHDGRLREAQTTSHNLICDPLRIHPTVYTPVTAPSALCLGA